MAKTLVENKVPTALVSQHINRPFFPFSLQPKLTINHPDDVYEREADAMADRVMRMPDHEDMAQPFFRPRISSLQRKCAHCEEEEKNLQRKELNNEITTASDGMESYVNQLNNRGQSLSKQAISFFEPRFGHDFSQVKVHTDLVAAKSAQSINALAYTSGSHIVFNQGQYSPETDSGKRLLGHELTHVVQQTGRIQTARLPCISRRKIDVYSVFLPGASRNDTSDIANANSILCQCGIELNLIGGESWSTNLMDTTAPLGVLNEYASPGSPTVEEQAMLSYQPSSALHLYYVPALSAGSEAEAFWPAAFPMVNNGVAISNGARGCAVAHEIGHVLLDVGAHHTNKDNLMAPGSINTCAGELEESQCNLIP